MRIGELRHRVSIQKKRITEDELKQQTENWADIATVWASIEPLSGREYFSARQENSEVTTKITIRYRRDITADMRVVFDGKILEVLSVINPQEWCKSLVLMCREVTV